MSKNAAQIKVGLIGTQFMGKAHSNAYMKLPHFFDLSANPVLQAVCGRNEANLNKLKNQFNWVGGETNWQNLVNRKDIDLIDISTPNDLHYPIAIEGAKNGKHLLCEKPMALNTDEAFSMYEAAEKAGVVHMMIFNYRFVPAIALLKKMISEGKIGEIRHFNAVYYQDWLVDPEFPYLWRHDSKTSGSGAHGDMNAHIIDLARFLVGEFEAVNGEQKTYIKDRKKPDGSGFGKVTTDDATAFMARFQNGAMGSFLATRMATGRKNFLRFELFGSEGAAVFNLERMNELQYFSREDEGDIQGYRTILVTETSQPFIDAWWPPGHIIGWEHTFIHQFKILMEGISKKEKVSPDFYDGFRCQQVLDAVEHSAKSEKWEKIEPVDRIK
ncbi:Gfo/Idh/MocA family protein [Flexithrix dorotheae]|uniref:Gfo/Idh/MocA family protein n=1 Tax=Flexithrix dorotheae TaxID=70993 RepID=UPI00037181F2|nr:Gfo/Idh/MocA family oxidoreductase [Flexithrix dorotheae]